MAGLVGHFGRVKRWATVTDDVKVTTEESTTLIRNAKILLSIGTSMASRQPLSPNLFNPVNDQVLAWAARLEGNRATTFAMACRDLFHYKKVVMVNSLLEDQNQVALKRPGPAFFQELLNRTVKGMDPADRTIWAMHNAYMKSSVTQSRIKKAIV